MGNALERNPFISLNVRQKLIIKIEILIVIFLLIVNLLQQWLLYQGILPKMITFIDLNTENNFPSFFSGMNLLFVGLIIFLISLSKNKSDRFYKHWLIMSLVFFFLGMDELASIHERIGRYTSILLGVEDTIGGFIWILPFSIILIILAYFYLPFLLAFKPQFQRLLVLSSLIFVGGGIVMEGLGSTMVNVSIYYPLEYIVEETMEMLGVILFLYTFLLYWKTEIGMLKLEMSVDNHNISKGKIIDNEAGVNN